MASTLTLYLINSVAISGAQGTLQFDSIAVGSPPNPSTMSGTGWQPGANTFPSSESSDLVFGSIQTSTSFSTTLGPSAGAGTTKCFVTGMPLYGSFDSSTWTIGIEAIMSTVATSGTGNFRARIYKGANISGSSSTELTTSTLVLGNFNLNTSTAQDTTVSWTPGAFSMNGEYLFLSLALEIQTGSVTNTSTECNLRTNSVSSGGGFDCGITTAKFTPTSTLYFMGTGDGTGGGLDGSVDQYLADGTWALIQPFEATDNSFVASAAFDPNSSGPPGQNGGPGGTCFFFGNTDASQSIASYNPATNSWVHFTTTLPTNCYGAGAASILNGVSYCVGGLGPSNTAKNTVYSWNNSQSITGSVNTSYGTLPEAVFSCMAITVGNLIYHGGGDDGTNSFGHWYKWNPLTDVRTSLHSMPTGLSGSGIVQLNGIIYCFAGYTNASTEASTQTVYAYNIAGDSWQTLNPYPSAAQFVGACLWNGNIYVGGGGISGLYLYNVGSDSYTLQNNMTQGVLGAIMFVAPPPSTSYTVLPTDAIFFGMT